MINVDLPVGAKIAPVDHDKVTAELLMEILRKVQHIEYMLTLKVSPAKPRQSYRGSTGEPEFAYWVDTHEWDGSYKWPRTDDSMIRMVVE